VASAEIIERRLTDPILSPSEASSFSQDSGRIQSVLVDLVIVREVPEPGAYDILDEGVDAARSVNSRTLPPTDSCS